MRTFWLFRSTLKNLEYYHQFNDLEIFEKHCHDFYMLLPLWLLKNNKFDRTVIWRLSNSPIAEKVFIVNGKKYLQKWVTDFRETVYCPAPSISFFRGGFPQYDDAIKSNPKHFGKTLYLGAGRRIFPNYGGTYDVYLLEAERDFNPKFNYIPFYKTANPNIFKPLNLEKKYDVCWPCNFEQLKYKGQELFIKTISKNDSLKKLCIAHCGNNPEIGKKLCDYYNVKNIDFLGSLSRPDLNQVLNNSVVGLNLSNSKDGCPRVSTEILMSGTPLIINEETRLLKYFKQKGVVEVNEKNLTGKLLEAISHRTELKSQLLEAINNELSFDSICKKNIELWDQL